MTGERVTAAERAAMDLRDLAARVDAVADLRGLEGVDRPLPDGVSGAELLPAERDRVRALADLLRLVASGLGGGGAPKLPEELTVRSEPSYGRARGGMYRTLRRRLREHIAEHGFEKARDAFLVAHPGFVLEDARSPDTFTAAAASYLAPIGDRPALVVEG